MEISGLPSNEPANHAHNKSPSSSFIIEGACAVGKGPDGIKEKSIFVYSSWYNLPFGMDLLMINLLLLILITLITLSF
jgi:hypothetical protein